jgi:uncharacterized protein YceK
MKIFVRPLNSPAKTLLLTGISALLLSGCAAVINLEAAPEANNPACAEVSVRLPDTMGEHEKRFTNAQATAAWGDPSAVILRCGLPPVEASLLPCATAGNVDWLVDDSQAPSFRFITFGREPAVEVIVDSERASGISTLESLSFAVGQIEASKFCEPVN